MGKKIDESAGIEDEKLFISIQLHDDIVLKSIASFYIQLPVQLGNIYCLSFNFVFYPF